MRASARAGFLSTEHCNIVREKIPRQRCGQEAQKSYNSVMPVWRIVFFAFSERAHLQNLDLCFAFLGERFYEGEISIQHPSDGRGPLV